MKMTLAGWLFLISAWSLVIGLSYFSISRILFGRRDKGGGDHGA